jgi:hypothetical protein
MIKPSKNAVISFAATWAPQYAELLRVFQSNGGRLGFPPKMLEVQRRVGAYVNLYEHENSLAIAVVMGLIGENGYSELNEQTKAMSEGEQQKFLDEAFTDDSFAEAIDAIEWPETKEQFDHAEKAFATLSKEEQKVASRRSGLLLGGIFGSFFNTLSIMVHRVRLTVLVKHALAADDVAFVKAIQIDPLLLTHHPYFADRKQRAQNGGET